MNSAGLADTPAGALEGANAGQNAVNANVPVNIAGGDIYTGDNSANQTPTNGSISSASNGAETNQTGGQSQTSGLFLL